MLELATPRLRLRAWKEADHAPFAALNADPAVMEHFPRTLDRAESDAMIARCEASFAEHGFGYWAVEVIEDGRFIGFVGLGRPRFEAPFLPGVEIGWRLAREAWGHGFATEAAREASRAGFETFGLPELLAFTALPNLRSQAVMQRLGMTRDPAEDFDHPNVPEGHALRRHVLYRLARPAG